MLESLLVSPETRITIRFLDKFVAKDILEHTGSDFLERDEEGRRALIIELSEDFGLDPEAIDIDAIVTIAEKQNFQLFIKEAFRRFGQRESNQ